MTIVNCEHIYIYTNNLNNSLGEMTIMEKQKIWGIH